MVTLRDVLRTDKEMILKWRNLPEVARYMYSDHFVTEEEHSGWFERILNDNSKRYWIIVSDDKDVGLANVYGLDQQNQLCYWAFYLASPSVRGKGVGSFAEYFILCYVFDELHLRKLCCEVVEFNEAVTEMHKSFGFKQEGLFREHIKKGDQFINVVRLAILKREWEMVKPEIVGRLSKKGLLIG